MDKPRIFLGSSGKQQELVEALTGDLGDIAVVEPWTTVFNPGVSTLERLLELTREPVGDWPLLAARVTQGESVLTGPFVLGTREPFSRLALGPAEAQGLHGLETTAGLPPRAFLVDAVEVSSGVGVAPLVVEAGVGWKNPTTLGRLGADRASWRQACASASARWR